MCSYVQAVAACIPGIGPVVDIYNACTISRDPALQTYKQGRLYSICGIVGNGLTIAAIFISVYGKVITSDQIVIPLAIAADACVVIMAHDCMMLQLYTRVLNKLQDEASVRPTTPYSTLAQGPRGGENSGGTLTRSKTGSSNFLHIMYTNANPIFAEV
jgi:hypothetical protein